MIMAAIKTAAGAEPGMPSAKAGMMLSVQIPAKMALAEGEEEVGAREGEATPESTTEEVEEVAEDVVVVAEVSIKHYIVETEIVMY
jgi:hypothetical protein